jgi:hypothetical protein
MPNPGNDSRSFEGLEGWREYQRFAASVMDDARYIRTDLAEQFLAAIRSSYDDRRMTVTAGQRYWRAQPGCILSVKRLTDSDTMTEQDIPHPAERMKPIVSWNHEGRANPRGIPYLYVATTLETALAEIRPWIGSINTCAEFEIQRDLRLVNCAKHHSDVVNLFGVNSATRDHGRWGAIDQAFATPIDTGVAGGGYVPTQTLAEMFKTDGFDGIFYKSRLNDTGFNIVLFDLGAAEVVDSKIYRTASIGFQFKPGESIRIPI